MEPLRRFVHWGPRGASPGGPPLRGSIDGAAANYRRRLARVGGGIRCWWSGEEEEEEEEEEGGGFIALHLRGICCAHHLPVGKTGVLTQTVRASL